jgi:hypothetical protein
MTLTTNEIIPSIERANDEVLEAYVTSLPADQVVHALHLITTLRKQLYATEKMLTSRIDGEAILGMGEVWTAPDGGEFMWSGDRSRKCDDAEGLKAALKEILGTSTSTLALRAFREAFRTETRVMLIPLDKVVQFAPETADTVRDFVHWTESKTRHLRPLNEEGK